jgi:hypothetical protein
MRFGNLDDWRSDRALESEGVPCSIGQGRELIVRRAGARNRAYVAGLADIAGEEDLAGMQRLFASTIVCGWRGLVDERGDEVPYSIEACIELFAQCPDLGDFVARFAAARANFHAAEIEEDAERLKVIPGGR